MLQLTEEIRHSLSVLYKLRDFIQKSEHGCLGGITNELSDCDDSHEGETTEIETLEAYKISGLGIASFWIGYTLPALFVRSGYNVQQDHFPTTKVKSIARIERMA